MLVRICRFFNWSQFKKVRRRTLLLGGCGTRGVTKPRNPKFRMGANSRTSNLPNSRTSNLRLRASRICVFEPPWSSVSIKIKSKIDFEGYRISEIRRSRICVFEHLEFALWDLPGLQFPLEFYGKWIFRGGGFVKFEHLEFAFWGISNLRSGISLDFSFK